MNSVINSHQPQARDPDLQPSRPDPLERHGSRPSLTCTGGRTTDPKTAKEKGKTSFGRRGCMAVAPAGVWRVWSSAAGTAREKGFKVAA
jgi:hypothetical protein